MALAEAPDRATTQGVVFPHAVTETGAAHSLYQDLPEGAIEGPDRWGWLTGNLRWAADIAGRVIVPTEGGDVGHEEFFGVDIHKVISTSTRDWATMLVQLYARNLENEPVEFTPRLVYVNFMASRQGALNVRLGHILIPFGLNIPSLAPGTLRQFSTGRNVGFKVDWGTSLNGVLPLGNYEVALSRGTGREYKSRDSPYLVSGRIGTPTDRSFAAGLSGLYGKVLLPGASLLTTRHRVGVDLRWQGGPVDALAEIAYGVDNHDEEVLNWFLELSWNSPFDSLSVYAQGRLYMQQPAQDWERTGYFTLGAQWNVLRHIWLSADYQRGLSHISRTMQPDHFRMQVRYRFF